MIDRRAFLNYAAVLPLAGAASRIVRAGDLAAAEKADYTLRIGTGLVELAPDHMKTKRRNTRSMRAGAIRSNCAQRQR